ncbi:aminopeptidase [Leptolyngbya boryana NIES-2135]|jgi:aminopeptidase YwaD|uniref:Aminopeptidase n=1 Tax=Leptolyngbya boryana NIES-2135 TaxID=1973484 RepID=A0A1Z4JCG0_LEPBY|nr:MULTISPECIES: M28 family metallopeptidase [Leptolyngbya]BAY54485.1 aminopeptidase [Leptolyngbya boryana NIES-2135]MBD2365480.1 M28 family peptidase [Leptolyngbya sp. FACHB-161]MBD2371660.1 M28 family peptidase [Leptolyngbya sp. FACHB-238]MBD2396085.1 M28 family peptidase [Leptolyngbya sp. FACHB-239]MBD2402608.1 M28 family peptidase [Leptolyngbya sp. FACHB-402]
MLFRSRRTLLNLAIAIFTIVLSLSLRSPNFATDLLTADVQALVKMGARVTGSPAAERASEFLVNEYRKAGYQVEIQPFSYPKFADVGSDLTVNGTAIRVWAMVRSRSGHPSGKLVIVPNYGTSEDFQTVNVKGAIALVRRGGGLTFAQKIDHAAAAGAIGIVIVNNQSDNVRGMLMQPSPIPAAAISGKDGAPLLAQPTEAQATLNVQSRPNAVGRNIIAHLPDVRQPKLIIGGHFDSVENSPGANDNASGTAVILALARQFAQSTEAQQIWFINFDGEEDGLKGSEAFVEQLDSAVLKSLKGMINFDMVGVNDRLLIDGSGALSAVATQSTREEVRSSRFGRSDHASFQAKAVPTLFFFRGKDPNYHSPSDKSVDPRLLKETQQAASKIISQLLK